MPAPLHAPATRARGRVLIFAFLLAFITYLDRVCISAAAPFMMKDLSLNPAQMGLVFSAFTLAYSIFEVPSGWLGDRHGPRGVLTRIVVWWSGFTAFTGAAQGYASLVSIRFLFGAGEAGAFPNMVRAFSRWFPARERGKANGVLFLGSRVGGMLSAPIAYFLIMRWGWRASFAVFGAIGLVWAAAWQFWYCNSPSDHPAVNAAELAWIEQDRPPPHGGYGPASGSMVPAATPWKQIVMSRNLWAICAMYFGFGYGLYFYLTWMPTYLVNQLGFTLLGSGFFASLPFLLAGVADVTGGWLTDVLARTRGLRVARCWLGCASFLASGALTYGSTVAAAPVAKAVLLACALGAADLAISACWAVPLDIGAEHAGVITGFMNTFGNLGGFLGPIVVGQALTRWGSWTYPLYLTSAIYVFSAMAWLFVDPDRQIIPRAAPPMDPRGPHAARG